MKVYIITGEASGDILAARLMAALRERHPGVEFCGVGGEEMAGQGFRSLFAMSELSVMGFWEVAPRLRAILRRVGQVVDDIVSERPDVVVTVDSWGFVEQVLSRLRRRGTTIPIVQYVAPQVWAWKKGRAKKVARVVDRLMTLWPNEPPMFEKYGLRSDFVGHPVIESAAAESARFEAEGTLLCLLPGSRHSEVKRLAPMMRLVAERLRGDFPDLEVVIPTVEGVADEVRAAFPGARVVMGQRERFAVFRACRFAVAASGTVSLELTACGAAHLIAYRFSWLTDKMAKLVVHTPFANMINILADREIIPEFVLENCREELIYEAAHELMRDKAAAREQVRQATEQLAKMKPEGMMPSQKAAEVVLDVVGGGSPK